MTIDQATGEPLRFNVDNRTLSEVDNDLAKNPQGKIASCVNGIVNKKRLPKHTAVPCNEFGKLQLYYYGMIYNYANLLRDKYKTIADYDSEKFNIAMQKYLGIYEKPVKIVRKSSIKVSNTNDDYTTSIDFNKVDTLGRLNSKAQFMQAMYKAV